MLESKFLKVKRQSELLHVNFTANSEETTVLSIS